MTARAKTPANSELSLTVSKLSLDLIKQWCCMDLTDRATYWRWAYVYIETLIHTRALSITSCYMHQPQIE